jgi:hypothetical protein
MDILKKNTEASIDAKNNETQSSKVPLPNSNKICGIVYGIHEEFQLWFHARYDLLWINMTDNRICLIMFGSILLHCTSSPVKQFTEYMKS